MTISIVSLLLLAVAGYFLIKTKPNLLLFDFMKEAFGEAKEKHHNEDKDTPQSENICAKDSSQQN
jgi:hypothetical protein